MELFEIEPSDETTVDFRAPGPALGNERAASLVSHGLVLALLVSVAISIIQFSERLLVDWEGGYLVWLTVVIGIESIAMTRALRRLDWFEADRIYLRGTEWIVILISLRGLIYMVQGIEQLREDITSWGFEFLNYFDNTEYFAVILFTFLIWSLASAFAQDLAGQQGDRLISDQETLRIALHDREFSRRRMVNRVFGLGILLVVLSALVRADLGILWGERPGFTGGGFNLLTYFLLGLALFSLSHYSTLRAFWAWDRIPIDQHLTRNWALYSISFLFILLAVVSFLPTRFSVSFLISVQGFLFGVLNLLNTLVTAIYAFGLLLIYLLSRLFGGTQGAYSAPERILPEFTPPPIPPAASPNPALAWLDTLRVVVLGVLFLVVVFYSFDYFLRHYHGRLVWVRQVAWVQALTRFWAWLLKNIRRWNKTLAQAAKERVDQLREVLIRRSPQAGDRLRLINPLRRSSRRQVIFYYLAMVRKGGIQGAKRKPAETPREYAHVLREYLPGAAEEVSYLTEAFSSARYSDREIEKAHAREARSLWRVIQKAFRSAAG